METTSPGSNCRRVRSTHVSSSERSGTPGTGLSILLQTADSPTSRGQTRARRSMVAAAPPNRGLAGARRSSLRRPVQIHVPPRREREREAINSARGPSGSASRPREGSESARTASFERSSRHSRETARVAATRGDRVAANPGGEFTKQQKSVSLAKNQRSVTKARAARRVSQDEAPSVRPPI